MQLEVNSEAAQRPHDFRDFRNFHDFHDFRIFFMEVNITA